jgi:6-phosphogluconolactonase
MRTTLALAFLVGMMMTTTINAKAGSIPVYIGTAGNPDADTAGIYLCQFNTETGALTAPKLAGHVRRPSWITPHPNGKFLYACDEMVDSGGKKSGGAIGFAVDPSTMGLMKINEESSAGGGPCFVEVDPSGRTLLIANYGTGSVAALPVDPSTGKLSAPASSDQHQGAGPNPKRQAGPHAHCFRVDPSGKFALSCDLGTDKVMIYRLDAVNAKITPNDPPFGAMTPGAGPRHIAFSPDGKIAYINGEMGGIVTAFAWDADKGTLTEIQTAPTLPSGYPDEARAANTTAQVLVSPNGKFFYVSNRGQDSIAVFAIDPTSGKLTPRGSTQSGGKVPRNFSIAPDGKFLIVGNQNSNELVVFKMDPDTGALAQTDVKVGVPSPTCVLFWSGPGPLSP